MDTSTETLPEWLTALPPDDYRFPVTKEHRELEQITFECVFERVIEGVEAGETVTSVIKAYPVPVDMGKFMRWVRKDSTRSELFEDAKQNGMLIMEDKLVGIADGEENSMEDVQRSKLRADTYKWIMQAWNRKRYGDKQQIDQTVTTIDLNDAMRRAEQMAQDRIKTIEGERIG